MADEQYSQPQGVPLLTRSRRNPPRAKDAEPVPAPKLTKKGTPYKVRTPVVPSREKWDEAVTPKFGPCRTKSSKAMVDAGVKKAQFSKGVWVKGSEGTLNCLTRAEIEEYALKKIAHVTLEDLKKQKTKKALVEYIRSKVQNADEEACKYHEHTAHFNSAKRYKGLRFGSTKRPRVPCAPLAWNDPAKANGCWLGSDDLQKAIMFLTFNRTDVVPGFSATSFVNAFRNIGKHVPEQIKLFKDNRRYRFLIFAFRNVNHWTCVVVERPKKPQAKTVIEYFDSFGHDIPNGTFVSDTVDTLLKEFPDAEIVMSERKHQQSFYECGVYVIWYIMCRLAGKSQKYVSQYALPDDAMRGFRESYFRGLGEVLDPRDDAAEGAVKTVVTGPRKGDTSEDPVELDD